jgi:hypothetical protein
MAARVSITVRGDWAESQWGQTGLFLEAMALSIARTEVFQNNRL